MLAMYMTLATVQLTDFENNKIQKSKRGIILKKKKALWIVSLDGIDCSFNSEHIFQVWSKHLQ